MYRHNIVKHIYYYIKKLVLLVLLLVMPGTIVAQDKDKYKISGQVIETENYAPVEMASVQLLSKDSVLINGVTTNDNGNFTTYASAKGKYKVRISFLGYKTLVKDIEVKSKTTTMGTLRLDVDSIMLEGATVTAELPKMQMVEDTIIYNADAYRMPDGSVLEELIERLPGAEVEDGKITINGKEIKKIMVDGKDFFTGNNSQATKNLPTDIIDKLKVYDEKSEMAKVTGIDDGNDQPVIDVRIKKGMNVGYMLNGDAAYGTHDRYSGRINAMGFTSKSRLALVGNGSNTSNGRSTPGRGGGGGGGQGLRSNETIGTNYNYSDKGTNGRKDPTLQINGNVNYNHGTSDRQTRSSSTNFEKLNSTTYSNSKNSNLSRNHGFNGTFRVEWRPDTLTNIQFSPTWSYTNNDSKSQSRSMQFSDNPFDYSDTPLNLFENFDDVNSIRTNHRDNRGLSHSENTKVGGWLQYNRRFGNMGRNLTLRVDANYSKNSSESVTNNLTHLYKVKDKLGNDSTFYTNRYSTTPSHNVNYSAHVTYSEPLMRATFLQFSYRFGFTKNESDQSTYDFGALKGDFGDGTLEYGGFDSFIGGFTEDDLEYYKNQKLSRYSRYENYDHDAQMLFRMIRNYYNFSTGVNVRPQRSHFIQDFQGVSVDTVRNILNINPTMNLQIRFSRQHTLKLDFHGNSSQPSINQLLDITNDNDPMNITRGNPGLKPSWTNNLNMQYANYLMAYKFNIALNAGYSTTSNSISSKVTYDDASGVRFTQPENINGNWRTNASLTLNKSFGDKLMLNLSSTTNYNYNHQVSYYTVDRNSSSQINTTNNTTLSERLNASLRNSWFELQVHGSMRYNHVRNLLRTNNNRDTYLYQYGGSANVKFPWNMTLDTSLSQNMNRGYTDATANTNELIWNAQLSQSFYKKALVLSVQVYDILGQQKSFDYNVGATRTSETHYNSITQYVMFHAIFNFRSFGGRAARDARRQRGEGWERPEGMGEGRPEGYGGGYGGGRPGGGFGGGRGGGRGR